MVIGKIRFIIVISMEDFKNTTGLQRLIYIYESRHMGTRGLGLLAL